MSSLLVLKHLKTLDSYGQNHTCAEPPVIANSPICRYAHQKKKLIVGGRFENTVMWEIRLGTTHATFSPLELCLPKLLGVADIFPIGITSTACHEILNT